MPATTVKIAVKSVEIGFSESPEIRQPKSFADLTAVDSFLMGKKAPERGGYYKTDFVITWQDGATYKGRYDIGSDWSTLTMHLRKNLELVACRWRPSHFKDEHWQHWTGRMAQEGHKAVAENLLDNYAI